MTGQADLASTQRIIAVRIALASGLAAAAFFAAIRVGFAPDLGTAVAFCALCTELPLAFCIGRLGFHRFSSLADIEAAKGGPPSSKALVLQAILQNTLEQAVLAWIGYAAVFALARSGQSGLPVIAAALFLAGRILFVRGYGKGAQSRALGFALTFFPTVLLSGIVVFDLLV